MTGSLQIKNNKYYAVLNIIGDDGKRKQKHRTEYGSLREVLRSLCLCHENIPLIFFLVFTV